MAWNGPYGTGKSALLPACSVACGASWQNGPIWTGNDAIFLMSAERVIDR